MAQFYKVLTANPMGEPWTPNKPGAKPILSFWCQVEGEELAVMVGKQVRDDGAPALYPGQHIYGDLMKATSQKGTVYWKFSSAQVPEGVQRPQDGPMAQAPVSQAPSTAGIDLSELNRKLDEVLQVVGLMDSNIDGMLDMVNDIHKVVYLNEKPIPAGVFDKEVQEVPFDEAPDNVIKTFGA